LPALAGCLETVVFDSDAMLRSAEAPELYATDVAESLVARGVPFREAHRTVGELLRVLAEEGRTLRDLSTAEWEGIGVPDGTTLLDPRHAVQARSMPGGPSRASVEAQLDTLERALADRR
ncbi:MAG: argininosuccinate lyase, partial [Actinomycetota bacterium]|nr:argininosuccinate lyase [Actinomycetota bacterium]